MPIQGLEWCDNALRSSGALGGPGDVGGRNGERRAAAKFDVRFEWCGILSRPAARGFSVSQDWSGRDAAGRNFLHKENPTDRFV